MSAEARPISPSRFARALEDLPVENIYAKAFEINNSIAHLEHSNAQLQEYSDSIKNDQSLDPTTREAGDKDCLDAIRENKIVIERQRERVELLKQEVERRGGKWHEASTNGGNKKEEEDLQESTSQAATTSNVGSDSRRAAGGRLTDEEIRRQMEERMGAAEDDDEEEGMHL